MDDNMQALMDALNNHQVTDENGETQAEEQTANEATSTHEEQAPVTETATVEKPAEEKEVAPNATQTQSENELAEDETGKRYVPEGRFKEVYAKQKQLERELAMAKAQANPLKDIVPSQAQPSQPLQPADHTAALEVELLKTTLPQFDPNSSEYSPELDELGVTIYNANLKYDAKGKSIPGITRIEAARRAIAQARKFTANQIAIATEARKVKALQSDQGITSRVISRVDSANVPPADASDQEMEAWLKANGQW